MFQVHLCQPLTTCMFIPCIKKQDYQLYTCIFIYRFNISLSYLKHYKETCLIDRELDCQILMGDDGRVAACFGMNAISQVVWIKASRDQNHL